LSRSTFSEGQRAAAVRSVASGTPLVEVCRRYGISRATFFRWKKRHGDAEPKLAARVRSLESYVGRLEALVERQKGEIAALRALLLEKYRRSGRSGPPSSS
jgi:putative transposase